jgi:nucleotide-binding universal stress UspA family protein
MFRQASRVDVARLVLNMVWSEVSMIVLKNILVATDFSEPSTVALAYGRDLARSYGSALHLVHVLEDVVAGDGPEVGFVPPELQKTLASRAQHDLDALITEDDRRTLKLYACVETWTSVAAGISDYANDHQIDLIIVGSHGRGPFKKFFLGSVAERVALTAPCPVLTVHAHEREFIAPDALVVANHPAAGARERRIRPTATAMELP